MKKEKPLVLRDSKDVKNIVVQVDTKRNQTIVISNFTPWENLALILEGLGVTVQKCVRDGIAEKKVHEVINNYLLKVLASYKTPKLS